MSSADSPFMQTFVAANSSLHTKLLAEVCLCRSDLHTNLMVCAPGVLFAPIQKHIRCHSPLWMIISNTLALVGFPCTTLKGQTCMLSSQNPQLVFFQQGSQRKCAVWCIVHSDNVTVYQGSVQSTQISVHTN